MIHRATPKFWESHQRLPKEIRELTDKNYALLKHDPQHPSLHFKKVGPIRSIRVVIHYRALAVAEGENIVWF